MQKIDIKKSMSDLHIQKTAINELRKTTKKFMIEIFENMLMFEILLLKFNLAL